MSDAPGDVINGLEGLHARQLDFKDYLVLSTRNDSVTAYEVSLEEMLCRCEDQSYNKEGGEVCDHLAVAILAHPTNIDPDHVAFDRAVQEFGRLQEAVKRLEQSATSRQAAQAGEPDSGADSPETEAADQGDTLDQSQAVEHIEDWLEVGYAAPQLVDVRAGEHDGRPGVVVEPDNQTMSEGQYESFKGLINAVDGKEVHVGFGDEPCNTCGEKDGDFWYFVPTADALEVAE